MQAIQTSITVDRVEPNFCFFPFIKYERIMVPDILTKYSSVILNRSKSRSTDICAFLVCAQKWKRITSEKPPVILLRFFKLFH